MIIDIKKLRRDLIDYFGAAMFSGFGAAVVDIGQVEKASEEELIQIAQKNGFNLKKYEVPEYER